MSVIDDLDRIFVETDLAQPRIGVIGILDQLGESDVLTPNQPFAQLLEERGIDREAVDNGPGRRIALGGHWGLTMRAATTAMIDACVPMDEELIDPARSALMARVRGKDTKPEIRVRRVAHALGYRFRLHRRDLPGSPDLVFPRHRKAVFVHGCFWHRHPGCKRTTSPKQRAEYWREKFRENVERDRKVQAMLRSQGWDVFVIWECETFDHAALFGKLRGILD